MTAFDTDILSDAADGVSAVVSRMAVVPATSRYVPVVAAEEAVRGQLDTIRKAQAGGRIPLDVAYGYFERTLRSLRRFQLLSYTPDAHALFVSWRATKIRVGTRDLRIAAICVSHNIKLATRNARDFAQVPGLNLEIWP